jgi:glycosyltransferase involved in cell wall biosynthesis
MNIGGPAIQAGLLTAKLDETRFETLLVAGSEGPAEGNILSLGRLPSSVRPLIVPQLGRRLSPLDDIRALWRVMVIARRYRPDIVHTHLAKAGFVGRIAARLAGARAVVHTYHGSVFRGYFGYLESAVYLGIERTLSRITTRIIAITPRQKLELTKLRVAPAEKIEEIPFGLDLEPFRNGPDRLVARRHLGIPANRPVVGLVARLVPIKDVPTFLRAMGLLVRDVPDVIIMIVGDGEDRSSLEAAARELGIGECCKFLGWRSDMPVIYSALDVLALSSLNEGSPVSLIEGMAARRAVVATAVGGVPDIVRHERDGLLVPARDHHALAAAVRRILLDPALASRLGGEGQRNAIARFEVSRMVATMERLYCEILGPRALTTP